MAEPATKVCASCRQEKPRSDYYARKANKDGLYSYCRECNTRKARERRDRSPQLVEQKREYDRKRSRLLADEYRARASAHYYANREQRIAYAREWAEKNPEKRSAIAQSYKHRRRASERSGMTGRELAQWKRTQPKICHWCGAKCEASFHVDHYVPLSKGGKHEASNLVIACRSCNFRKNAKDPFAFAREMGRLF